MQMQQCSAKVLRALSLGLVGVSVTGMLPIKMTAGMTPTTRLTLDLGVAGAQALESKA